MRILYSCPLDPIKLAAPGQHVASVVRELAARGHTMTLVHQGGLLAGIDPSLQYPLKLKRDSLVGRLLADLQYAAALIKILRKNEYDHVYHRLEKWSILPLILFKFFRIPVVLEFNSDVRAELGSVNASTIVRKVYPLSECMQVRLASKIVVVSEGIRNSLIKNIPAIGQKIMVIENGADTEIYFPRDRIQACATLGLDPTKKYVIFSGSFQPWQGLETLISSACDVLQSFPNVRFILIGDGRQRTAVEQQIKEKSLESSFMLTGWLEPHDVAFYLAASSICVAPYSALAALDPSAVDTEFATSLMKCSPLKIYTYMAMGKPVVASGFLDSGQRIVEWETGLAFKPGSASELASSLMMLLNDETMADRFGEKAAERAKLHHTWAAVAERIDESCLQNI